MIVVVVIVVVITIIIIFSTHQVLRSLHSLTHSVPLQHKEKNSGTHVIDEYFLWKNSLLIDDIYEYFHSFHISLPQVISDELNCETSKMIQLFL